VILKRCLDYTEMECKVGDLQLRAETQRVDVEHNNLPTEPITAPCVRNTVSAPAVLLFVLAAVNVQDLIAAAAQGNLHAGLNQSTESNRQSTTGVSNEQGPKSQSSSSSGADRGDVRWRAAAAVLSAAALTVLL
jgi:hypothetical protein